MRDISGNTPSDQQHDKPPRRHWKATEPFFDLKLSHWIGIILTAALVGVGVGQIIIYAREARIMQTQDDIAAKQTEIAAAANRAVVNLHSIGLNSRPPYNDYTFKIGNDGNSTTRGLSIVVDCVWSDKSNGEPFDLLVPNKNNSLPNLIPPKAEVSIPGPGSDCRIPLKEATAIVNGSKHFYFLGKITYRDGIDPIDIHTTEFAEELVIDNGVSHAVSRGRHNCADNDCPKRDYRK